MMRAKILFALLVLSLLISASINAQSLLDNEDMQKAREFQQLADEAMEEGRYDDAVQYSQQASEFAARGEQTAEIMALSYRANSLRNRASSRLYYAQRIGVPNRDAEAYSAAQTAFAQAEALLEQDEYAASMDESRKVLSLLEEFQPRHFVAERPAANQAGTLPQFYIVRLIPERRDCFWRIAEYDFVYGDPWLWPRLYEQNKEILHDPENPDLIHPGMKFEIPNRADEVRSGIWNPQDQ